jgi:hypothetical protein
MPTRLPSPIRLSADIDAYELAESSVPMELDGFWGLVHETLDASTRERIPHHEALLEQLVFLPIEEVGSFFRRFRDLVSTLDNKRAYAVLGGSDDGFLDGRSWAVSQGRAFYEQLRDRPASLLGAATEEYESFAYVCSYALEAGADRQSAIAKGLARHEARLLRETTPDARLSSDSAPRL